jgi:hypothetical protein
MNMSDKNSPHYVRSELKRGYYREKNTLTYKESLKVEGNDEKDVNAAMSFLGDMV